MNKIKKMILAVIVMAGILVLIASVYTAQRKEFYNIVEGRIIQRYDRNFFLEPEDTDATAIEAPYLFSIYISNESGENILNYGVLWSHSEKIGKYNKIHLSNLEYCLIMDAANSVFKGLEEENNSNYDGKYRISTYFEQSLKPITSKEDMMFRQDISGEVNTDKYITQRTVGTTLFALFIEGFIYIRRGYPLAVFIIIILAVLYKKVFENYRTASGCTNREILEKAALQKKFVRNTVVGLLMFDVLFLVLIPLIGEIIGVILQIPYKLIALTLGFDYFKVAVNYVLWAAVTYFQIKFLYKNTGSKKMCMALVKPTAILFVVQFVLFSLLLGIHSAPDGGYFVYRPTDTVFRILRDRLGMYETMIIPSKTAIFMLFFALGLILFYSFGDKKNKYITFAWSTAFAACNAFMCCLSCYIINFWRIF